jgi:nitroimidazol reductase NimA-like FMN-containing flavoprotein (pyridoxamine 5'-phosphate oxidase superfamily)
MTYKIKPTERSNEECESIIKGSYHGVLSFSHENEPYAVPINHAYEDGKFYFHCAVGGKKIDFIKRNPSVVYTIMKYYGTPEDFKSRNNCHGKWESIIAYGNARYVENEQELQEILNNKFLKYYGKDKREISRSFLLETRAIVMEVTKITARRELEAKETEFYEWEK